MALEKYQEAIKMDTTKIEGYIGATLCFVNLQLFDKAIRYAKTALSINPLNPFPYYIIGISNAQFKKYSKAEKYLKKAIDLNSSSPLFWMELGSVYLTNREIQSASKCLDKALALNPNFGKALNLKAYQFFIEGNHQRAQEFIEKALQLEPENPYYHAMAGRIFGQQNSKIKPQQHFKTAIQLDPENEIHRQQYLESTLVNHYWWGDIYPRKDIETRVQYFAFYVILAMGYALFSFFIWGFSLMDEAGGAIMKMVLLIFSPAAAIYVALPTLLKIWRSYKDWGVHGITLSYTMLHVVLLEFILGLLFYGILSLNNDITYVAFSLTLAGAGLDIFPNIKRGWKAGLLLSFLLVFPMVVIPLLILHKGVSTYWLIAVLLELLIIMLISFKTNNPFKSLIFK
ncbi:MAG: tetratricopeptide repeat protein [Saprospiraceae bacterium]